MNLGELVEQSFLKARRPSNNITISQKNKPKIDKNVTPL